LRLGSLVSDGGHLQEQSTTIEELVRFFAALYLPERLNGKRHEFYPGAVKIYPAILAHVVGVSGQYLAKLDKSVFEAIDASL
jgi:hypothetical protein